MNNLLHNLNDQLAFLCQAITPQHDSQFWILAQEIGQFHQSCGPVTEGSFAQWASFLTRELEAYGMLINFRGDQPIQMAVGSIRALLAQAKGSGTRAAICPPRSSVW